MKVKKRADSLLVEKKIVESRSKAQALILAGSVKYKIDSDWEKVKKAGDQLSPDTEFQIQDATLNDVGRGAQKLRAAFETWSELEFSAKDGQALDIGSSTGGFTQVLLEKGAASVVAVDVGTHQLHERLRNDSRVLSLEKTHILRVDSNFWKTHKIDLPFDVLVTDVSFISVKKVMSHAKDWLKKNGCWLVLVKPQFELDAKKVPKGIVKNQDDRNDALNGVISLANQLGCFRVLGQRESPITGADGNVEYLLCLQKI